MVIVRERYFRMYESIKYKEFFYSVHSVRARRLYEAFSLATLTISVVSVLVWSISKSMPALWALIIAAAQLAQSYCVRLPYAGQIAVLKFLLPELSKLTRRIDDDWLALDVNEYSDRKILALISEYEKAFSELEAVFTNDVRFPRSSRVLAEAEKRYDAYFESRYYCAQEGQTP